MLTIMYLFYVCTAELLTSISNGCLWVFYTLHTSLLASTAASSLKLVHVLSIALASSVNSILLMRGAKNVFPRSDDVVVR